MISNLITVSKYGQYQALTLILAIVLVSGETAQLLLGMRCAGK